jgi:hypothetical protein
MRYRVSTAVAVVSGALVLTAAVVPAGQADGQEMTPAFNPVNTMNVTFSNVSVDKGAKGVAVGTTNIVHVPYTYTLTATGVDPTDKQNFSTSLDLYRGTVAAPTDDLSGNHATCKLTSTGQDATGANVFTEACSGVVDIYPHDLGIPDAGASWHAIAYAFDAANSGWAQQGGFTAPAMQRYSRLTVNASPEPVTKGKTITIVGSLTRANWDTHKYAGYTVQPVKLQFRPKTSNTYTTLKTVTTDSHGNLKTTSKATVDGYWRYSFAGTTTTPAVTPPGDYVDVR